MGFLLNSVLFVLIGLQLHTVLEQVSDRSTMTLVLFAALISLAVMAIRALLVFPMAYLPRRLSHGLRQRDPISPWQHLVVVANGGMRGAISLALALSLPLATQNGASFPERDLIIFVTFGVILVTLVLQGLSLPLLIRRLGLEVGAAENSKRRPRLAYGQRKRRSQG